MSSISSRQIASQPLKLISDYLPGMQGSFMVAIDAERLQPLAELKAEMDRMVSDGEKMQPLPGMDR